MSIEDIKLMGAYMTVHSKDKDECECIGHSLINKSVASMNGIGDMPGLSDDKRKEFFDLINGNAEKHDLDAFKRNLIVAGAIQLGNLKDVTKGATDFSEEKPENGKITAKSKNYYFYKPQDEGVISSKPKSPKRRKTKKEV